MQAKRSALDADRISRVVFEYAARIGSAQDTLALLHLHADLARDLVGAERCSVWLVDAGSNELWTKVAHGVDEIRIPPGHGLVGACISRKEVIVVNDTASDTRFLSTVDQKNGYLTRSMAVLPLRGENGRVIGALQALNKPGGFSTADANLLGLAAAYSTSAIETQQLRQEAEAARRLYHELEIARDVQRQLLPRSLPKVAGVDCAAFCRPAGFVGGDYYDIVAVPDGRIVLSVGDISGKGVAAAVMMASIQTSLRAQVMHSPDCLARMMSDFNSAVYAFSDVHQYSTLFYALLDVATRKLTYVNAGHVRPLVVRAAGTSSRMMSLDTTGFPVGLFETAGYEQVTIQLEPGDIVLCYSDGFSDAVNTAGKQCGDAAIANILQQHRNATAQEIIDRLVAGTDAFAGSAPQADDMTAVVLRIGAIAPDPPGERG